MNTADLERLRKTVSDFKKVTDKELKAQFTSLNIEHVERSPSTTPAVDLLKSNIGYSFGMPEKVRFKFPRHLVFVHKGVGRGGTAGRTPKEWFNPVMEKQVEKLADQLGEDYGDLAVNAINIK